MHFKQLLFSSLLFGLVLAKEYSQWTQEEKDSANTVMIVCIVVGVLISFSAMGAGAFFYMMRKRNNNNGGMMGGGGQGGVVVVH